MKYMYWHLSEDVSQMFPYLYTPPLLGSSLSSSYHCNIEKLPYPRLSFYSVTTDKHLQFPAGVV